MKKKIIAILIGGALLLGLAACSAAPKETDATGVEETTEEVKPTEPDQEKDTQPTSGTSNSELPSSVSKKFEEVCAEYDKLIAIAEGYIENPDTYTASESTKFSIQMAGILTPLQELDDEVKKHNLETEDYLDEWLELMHKQSTLSSLRLEFPDIKS